MCRLRREASIRIPPSRRSRPSAESRSPSPEPRATPMASIKRTKFKLTTEQLLEMLYWLKLIRAFDERLSVLVRQGRCAAASTPASARKPSSSAPASGCEKEDYICPLHRDLGSFLMKGVEPGRDDGADVREGHGPVEGARLGAAQRRARAGHLRQHEHARREPAGGRRARADLQDGAAPTTSSSRTSARARATRATSTRR